jgi:hypothetical protein
MSIDVKSLTDTMIGGVRKAVGQRWPAIRALAEAELGKVAQTIRDVGQMVARGEITADRALEYVEMQRNHALSVLITVKGLGLLTAREALDAAARAIGPVQAHFKAGKDI